MKLSDLMDEEKGATQSNAAPPDDATEQAAPEDAAPASEAGAEAPDQATDQQEAAPEGAPEDQDTAAPVADSSVTPQEQEIYDNVVVAGNDMLFKSGHDATMKMLKSGTDNPVATMVELVFQIVKTLDANTGHKIPVDLVPHIGAELMSHVADLVKASGVFPIDQTIYGKAQQQLMLKIVDAYGCSEEDVKAALRQFSPEEIDKAHSEQDKIANAPAGGEPAPPDQGPPDQPPEQPPGILNQGAAA